MVAERRGMLPAVPSIVSGPLGHLPSHPLRGQPHRDLADPAFYIGGEILLVIAGKVHHGLPCPIEKGGVKKHAVTSRWLLLFRVFGLDKPNQESRRADSNR